MRLPGSNQWSVLLGPLEIEVMDVVWQRGTANVRAVCEGLSRPLAYTTVMTTLDRLFKKGLLLRTKAERAFVYAARLSREAWERQRADELVAGFLAGPLPARAALLSCLLEAVGEQDAAVLDELGRKIRARRRQLERLGENGGAA